jgi:hypothetical protein
MFYYSFDNFKIQILEDQADISKAQQLIFQTYVQGQNWHIPNDNLSGIHVHTNFNGETILMDDYDKFSIWAGIFYNKKLIACGRIVNRDNNGLLEIERYPISDKLRSKICISSLANLVELNRSAIHQDYRNTIAWPSLLNFAFEYCEKMGLSAIATTAYDKVKQFHSAIGFKVIEGESFKYHSNDESSVDVYFADFSRGDICKIIKTLDQISDKKNKLSSKSLLTSC